jgi:hypothetical protein
VLRLGRVHRRHRDIAGLAALDGEGDRLARERQPIESSWRPGPNVSGVVPEAEEALILDVVRGDALTSSAPSPRTSSDPSTPSRRSSPTRSPNGWRRQARRSSWRRARVSGAARARWAGHGLSCLSGVLQSPVVGGAAERR